MKVPTLLLAAVTALAGMSVAAPAAAHGRYYGGGYGYWRGPSVSLYYGGPLWWGAPAYYGPGYGYVPPAYVVGPPAVVTSTAGVTYIERDQNTVSTQQAAPPPPAPAAPAGQVAPAPASQWWYLCASPRGAYPYVRECPGGWERVPAVPPGPVR